MKIKLTYRMYGFVPYNISEIQKGIQFGHAVVEYTKSWVKSDKTFVILNGGPVNNNNSEYGMAKILKELRTLKVKFSKFYEPDLNDALSGIAFLVDERVYDKKHEFAPINLSKIPVDEREEYVNFKNEVYADPSVPDLIALYYEWVESIGGKQNERLRYYLRQFDLA